jgi:flavorubredoxin
METRIDEIADDVFRLSTLPPGAPIMFNQFLVRAEQPLLFHTGHHSMFPAVSKAVASLVPIESLRWITFGHVESDECGAMNDFLAVAPQAQVAHGALGNMVQVNELADREPYGLSDFEVLDLGGKKVRNIDTPHLPHGWDAHVMFEETTGTLLCGDLFTRYGDSAPITTDDIVEAAFEAEEMGAPTALTPTTGSRIRALAELNPTTLALMHGPSFTGDCTQALIDLGNGYDQRFWTASRTESVV